MLQLIWLAIIQGATELFPVSSLGHSVLVPAVLNWPIDRDAPWFLPFIVVLHLGTAAALFLYFWRDWLNLFVHFLRDRGRPRSPESRLLWLLIVGTIPAGLLGLALEHLVRRLFAGFEVAAFFLMLNGVMLILGDRLRKNGGTQVLATMRWRSAAAIGCAQALALIPGVSRSGVTLVSGLAADLDYASAARFSFLLATPIIAAAGALEVPKLLKHHAAHGVPLDTSLLCGVLAGVFAFLSTAFLMRYFKQTEITALRPFGIYCLIAGAGALALHWL
ncbi:MAG TPA: undecaprenyl-diphosphate phosphatase [Nitrococcus sp.]|nr:undecaprenyl-diphosphate phosphatase [Nitrococcus sp.]